MDYNDICGTLKYYSFSEKMKICNEYSSHIMDIDGNISVEQLNNDIYPWELESFLLMCVKSTPECGSWSFDDRNLVQFCDMINAIRNFKHPKFTDCIKKNNNDLAHYYLSVLGLNQFDIQETSQYKMYRYNYIFNFCNDKVNMAQEFQNMFGTDYNDFLQYGTYLMLLYGSGLDKQCSSLIDHFSCVMHPIALTQLSISLEEYKKTLDSISTKIEDYSICLRPSYQFPFILKEGIIYLPLPHLIGRAITSSLLYRITERNGELRQLIGKEVLETYLLKILKESGSYEEVFPERKYYREKGTEAKTLDVMLRDGEDYIFVESKSSVPRKDLRILDKDTYTYELNKLVDKVELMYKHLRVYLPKYKEYSPFKVCSEIEDKHLWGVCVMLEDNFIMRRIVYYNAAERLKLEVDSPEYKWLIEHIKITSLYNIEKYSLNGCSLLIGLKKQQENGLPDDFPFLSYIKEKKSDCNWDYMQFIKKIEENYYATTYKLQEAGFIT